MEKKADLSTYVSCIEAPAGLYQAILSRVAYAKRRAARIRTVLFGVLALTCAVLLVPVLQYAAEQFYASGFYNYLTLIISDRGFVFTYWQQFTLSLLESLPSLALLLVIPVVGALMYSLHRIVQTSRVAFKGIRANA